MAAVVFIDAAARYIPSRRDYYEKHLFCPFIAIYRFNGAFFEGTRDPAIAFHNMVLCSYHDE